MVYCVLVKFVVILRGVDEQDISKGFFIQARSVSDDQLRGNFQPVNTDSQRRECGENVRVKNQKQTWRLATGLPFSPRML
jgi:hypothetical protein